MWSLIRIILFVFSMTVNFMSAAAVDDGTAFDGTESPSLIIPTDNQTKECTENCTPSPSPTMSPTPFFNPSPEWDTTTSVDILVAALFLIAAGWLVLAIIYSALILIVVRMRSRGELDIYDENFGRIFLFGGRCYIPLGCLLRRHVVALNRRNQQNTTVRLMTRGERRSAMEELLTDASPGHTESNSTRNSDGDDADEGRPQHDQNAPASATTGEDQENNDLDSNGEPVCSICLMEYEEGDVCFTSRTCVHKFHRDCILDWLERRDHTECPCCREPMVADEDVWDSVQLMRRQQRKLRRRQTREKGVLGLFSCFCASCCCCIVVADNSFQEGEEINDVEAGHDTGFGDMEAPGNTTVEQHLGLGVGMGVPFGGNHESPLAHDSGGVNSSDPTVGMGVPCGDIDQEAALADDSEGLHSNDSSVGMGVPCVDVEQESPLADDNEEVTANDSNVGMGVPCGDVEQEDPVLDHSAEASSHEPSDGVGVPCDDVEQKAAVVDATEGEQVQLDVFERSVGMGVPCADVDNGAIIDSGEANATDERSPDSGALE